MDNRIRLALAVPILALLVGGVAWMLHDETPSTVVAAQAAANPTANPAAPVDTSTRIPQPPPSTSLPAIEAPLGLVIDDLRRRAAAGEAGATCRLASEYVQCEKVADRRGELDRWLAERRRALDHIDALELKREAAANIDRELALRDEQIGEIEEHCKDVKLPDARTTTRLWRAAALAGDPAAMRQYASGNAFPWDGMLDALPELATYRQEAEHIALVAARRGDLDMLIALAGAYQGADGGGRSLLQQAVRPDPAMALAMYRHIDATLRRHGSAEENITFEVGERIADLEAELEGPDLSRADTLAAGIARDWTPAVVRGVKNLRAGGRVSAVDRRWCGR